MERVFPEEVVAAPASSLRLQGGGPATAQEGRAPFEAEVGGVVPGDRKGGLRYIDAEPLGAARERGAT